MLLQYLRTAEASVESAIAWNLVHLALAAPQSSFVDIIRSFCYINRTGKVGENRTLNNMARHLPLLAVFLLTIQQVLAAQTRLAQSIKLRPQFYDVYLMEILSLFADKGISIQTATTTHNNAIEVRLRSRLRLHLTLRS